LRFGLDHLEDIARREHGKIGISEALAREYLTRNIVFELGEREYAGLTTFLQYAMELGNPVEMARVSV
jgi:predicted solute-binding protein